MVKSLEGTKAQEDYHNIRYHGEIYLIPYAEIVEFNPETDHFRGVYQVTGDVSNGRRLLVREVEDTSLLEAITEAWENGELNEVVSRHDVTPPSDMELE